MNVDTQKQKLPWTEPLFVTETAQAEVKEVKKPVGKFQSYHESRQHNEKKDEVLPHKDII